MYIETPTSSAICTHLGGLLVVNMGEELHIRKAFQEHTASQIIFNQQGIFNKLVTYLDQKQSVNLNSDTVLCCWPTRLCFATKSRHWVLPQC